MAQVKSEYIAVNELRALSKDASNMMFEGSRIRIAWAEGKRVWDVWETILSAYDTINVESKATTLTKSLLNLQSYGTDRLGVNHDMAYTISPTSISANTSTSSKNHAVTVKQTDTGKSISVTATQAGRVATKITYKTPTVTSTSISTVPASGNVTRKLTVYWSQVKETTYDNNTTSTETVTGSSTATVTSGSATNSSGAYISSGGVYVPSAGTTYYTSQRTAYTISEFTFTANGVSSGSVSRTVYVYQSANTRTSTTEYSVYCGVASPSSIANTGGTFSFSATCQSRPNYTYASGSTENGSWVDAKATVSYSNGVSSVSTASFTGSATITATVGENIGDSRNPRVTVKATDYTSESDYTQVTQSAVSYTFTAITSTSVSLDSTTTSFSVFVRSERNGKPWAISSSNVSAGDYASVVGVNQSSYPTYQYNITLSTTENNSSSNRNYSIIVTQPSSGKTLTFNVIHSSATSSAPISYIWKFENDSYCIRNGWYLGQIPTGATTNGRPVYHIVAVTTKANSQAASIYAEFDYTYNPSDAAGNLSGSVSKAFSYTAGATISVDGTSYYGVILVTGLPAISQGTVTEFTVTKT